MTTIDDLFKEYLGTVSGAHLATAGFTAAQIEAVKAWGNWVLASRANATKLSIKKIKYDGHVVMFNDGSRWEVKDDDIDIVGSWSEGDEVVLLGNRLLRIDDCEIATVSIERA
jgi:hypothetical protein